MKTIRTRKSPIKNSPQRILGPAFGTDRERVKPFSEDDRGEDRRFETFLPGFRYKEENHEASRYLFKTVARVTLSSRGRVTIPREVRTRLDIKPGQRVSITAVDGAVQIIPMRQSRRSERGSLPRLKPFVREGKSNHLSGLKQMLETPSERLGRPSNPAPSKVKKIWKTVHSREANDD